MIEALYSNISRHISCSRAEMNPFLDLFTTKSFKKKDFFIRQGEICKFEAFVTKGLFKVYHLDVKGAERILYFAMEDWWITDIDSFTTESGSQLFIEAIEDSEIFLISKKDKDFAYQNFPVVEKLFRVMTQKAHVALQRRMIDNLSKTADQRYLDFIGKYPSLYLRLTNLDIAAYLGISHEFLSKIRRKTVHLK